MRGITAALGLVITLVTSQAAALWGDVDTFVYKADLNGAPVQFAYQGSTRDVLAGAFRANMSDGRSFLAFCTDALNPLASGWFESFDAMPSNPDTNPIWAAGGGSRAAAIYNACVTQVCGMPGSIGVGSTSGDFAAAGLQVAIWKALYDTTTDLSGGSFTVMANGSAVQQQIIDQAELYLSVLNGFGDPEGAWNGNTEAMWWRPVDANGARRAAQGLIGANCVAPQSVPAPPGFALASLTAGLLGFLARRRMTT
ncbi:MAG: hypothetical protein KJ072_25990 [Verrucomicrobia bacterium]|nr:hypothetical protein [Verrucomicrobiota bacterium]